MKELSLYKIRDMAINSELSVYSVQEISNLINKNKNIARVYMNRLVQKGLATRLVNGKISFINDDFIIYHSWFLPRIYQ